MNSNTDTGVDPATMRRVFASVPTPIVVIAGEVDSQPVGMTAGSFTAQSVVPPLVSVSIQNTSTTWPKLRRAEQIGISVLTEDHAAVVRQFAGPATHRFQGVDYSVEGAAITLADATVALTTTVDGEVPVGDHTLAILKVSDVRERPGADPLIYHGHRVGGTRAIEAP